MTTQTFPADLQDPAPALSGHPSAWVGVTIGSHRFAVSATDLLALFQWQATAPSVGHAPLDVVVHAGSPVFIVPVDQLFEIPKPVIQAPVPGAWILVRRLASGACLGCRVDAVQGPFSGPPLDAKGLDGAITWIPIHAKKERHG